MGQQDNPTPALPQPVDRGEGGLDAHRVGNLALTQGNVEIDPHKRPLALEPLGRERLEGTLTRAVSRHAL